MVDVNPQPDMPKAPQNVKILKKNHYFRNLRSTKKSAIWLTVDVNPQPDSYFFGRWQAALFTTPASRPKKYSKYTKPTLSCCFKNINEYTSIKRAIGLSLHIQTSQLPSE